MMQPMDPLSQLAMCCGLGGRRRDYKPPRNYFYSPSSALLDPGSGWPVNNPYGPPQPQPYFLFTQPVIIASNPVSNPTNTMTLVQHAQTAHPNTSAFPTISIMGASSGSSQQQQQHHHLHQQPSIISSQYAIYNTSTALNTSVATAPTTHTIYEHTYSGGPTQAEIQNQSTYLLNKSPALPIGMDTSQTSQLQQNHIPQQSTTERKPVVTLNSEIFRQLEVIEKQTDISRDMELVERLGLVITRALDPYTLMPHLTEATLRKYHSHFLFSDNYVIRFIEIIKRPGQTLGLYIRTVQFEDTQSGRGTRGGLVITRIDSDSPVYNSQVLHVGDEILSVNLVDIQGMSLDDVVIIMSIPKRLVLAIQIPRERDQLLSMNLMQQQQMLRNSLEQREMDAARGYQTRIQNPTLGLTPTGTSNLTGEDPILMRQTSTPSHHPNVGITTNNNNPIISNLRLGDTPEQSSYFSSSIDAINRELKELRRQRIALSSNEQNINSARMEF